MLNQPQTLHTLDIRQKSLLNWLTQNLTLNVNSLEPASQDASFRRYFRAQTDDGVFIVMDAPPEKEPITQFINVSNALRSLGVHVPKIHHHDYEQGFILMEDLGNRTFLDELSGNANELYNDAMTALITIQQGSTKTSSDFEPPQYDAHNLAQEMDLFKQWFIGRHLGLSLNPEQESVWNKTKESLIAACLNQPQVWVHRDYHSRNLMVTEDRSPGVIDFQDLMVGPIAYDLASIFKDCYIEWPRKKQLEWLEIFRVRSAENNGPNISADDLITWFDLVGLQRHLKVLGIFCRLYYRDGKDQYLADLPLVAKYTLEVLDIYPQLHAFKSTFSNHIESALK